MSNKVEKLATWLVIPDTHLQAPRSDGTVSAPEFCHSPEAISIMLQWAKDHPLDGIIHLGDICEMDYISHWSKDAGRLGFTKDDKGKWYAQSWRKQKEMVYNFWKYLAKIHPKAKRVQLEGNHDEWSRQFFSNPLFEQFQDDPEFNPQKLAFHNWPVWKDFDIEYHRYWGGGEDSAVFISPENGMLAPMPDVNPRGSKPGVTVLHGFNNASVKRLFKAFDNIVYGHSHKILIETYDGNVYGKRRAVCTGCLTKLRAEYSSKGRAINEWAHAFTVIHVFSSGEFQINLMEIQRKMYLATQDGQIYLPKQLSKIDPMLKCLELPV